MPDKEPTLEITLSEAKKFRRFLVCAANEAIERFKLEKKFYTTDFIELGKFLAEIEEMDKKTLKPFLDKHEEKDDLPF